MIKNLIYYSYFNKDNIPSYIHNHLYLLNRYKDIFDGIKIIYIATDNLDDSEELKAYFSFLKDAIIRVVKNNKEDRESVYFMQQMSEINSLSDKNSITFYAHTKGSTYENNEYVLKWITCMYFFNLESEYLKKVEDSFKQEKAYSGIFRIPFPCNPWVSVDWHYSGTFFWINNNVVFTNDWSNHYIDRFSVESYPGSKFNIDKSAETEILFTNYSNSFLPQQYNRYDLRYFAYWDLAFSGVIGNKIDKFNSVLEDMKNKIN